MILCCCVKLVLPKHLWLSEPESHSEAQTWNGCRVPVIESDDTSVGEITFRLDYVKTIKDEVIFLVRHCFVSSSMVCQVIIVTLQVCEWNYWFFFCLLFLNSILWLVLVQSTCSLFWWKLGCGLLFTTLCLERALFRVLKTFLLQLIDWGGSNLWIIF